MNILGISAYYHDSAACLVKDGDIIAAAQEERFTRKKHDPTFPQQAIQYCLKEGKLTPKDLNYVVFYDKPFLTFERLLMTYLTVAPKGLRSWLQAMPLWLGKKIHIPKIIKKELGYDGEVFFTEHHEAHASSAFYPSPFKEAAILTIDGVGEWATASYGFGLNNSLTLLKEMHFPDSLGLLYSAFTYFTGFKVNSGEYKLMGLAPYGKPKYVSLIMRELVDLKEDGSLRLNMRYFDFLGGQRMTNRYFEKLFEGPPRRPENPITQREMDLAASIQNVTEEAMLRMAKHVHKETGFNKLCLAGGVALNCVANGRILREGPFKDLWIQPASGDAGGALGSALYVWYRLSGKDKLANSGFDLQKGSYLGPSFADHQVLEFLNRQKYPHRFLKPEDRSKEIAQILAAGKIVGYLAGRMEFGPRALGARSILGDPRRDDTQSIMNLKIKFRESFRPFAPSILEEKADIYFDLTRPSPYMLLVANLLESKRLAQTANIGLEMLERLKVRRSEVPAITHIDYSARLQTVTKEDNPDYYSIILDFEKLTGCPMIVNTSFNVRGEPIVCTLEDAYRCFMRTDMDALVLENFLLLKNNQPPWKEKKEWRNDFNLD